MKRFQTLARNAGARVACLTALGLVFAGLPGGWRVPAQAAGLCSVAAAGMTASASPNVELNQRFTTYGNNSRKWVGADSTYSVPLADGSVAWLFSDTLYGKVNNNQLSPTKSSFLNNSIIRQQGSRLIATHTAGTTARPRSLVEPDADADWYWFGDGELRRNGQVQVGLVGFERTGTGSFDFAWATNKVATIDTKTWEVVSLAELPSASGVQWASFYQRIGNAIMVYGVEDLGSSKYLHIARVEGDDLSDLSAWKFWDGVGWSTEESASAPVMSGVGNEFSVVPFRDGYLMITQDTTVAFSNEIVAYASCSPTGPFINRTVLYKMPEVGAYGSYDNPNIFAYNAHEHQQLRTTNGAATTVVVSYNVNSLDSSEIFEDVSIYRPRFVSITLNTSSPTAPGRT